MKKKKVITEGSTKGEMSPFGNSEAEAFPPPPPPAPQPKEEVLIPKPKRNKYGQRV